MKSKIFLASLLSATLSLAMDTNTTVSKEISVKQEGFQYIQLLAKTLKSEMQTYMKADKSGLAAMGFCSAQAQSITASINTKLPQYASVRRTALKTRNEKNAPDALDTKVMQEYQESMKSKTFSPSDIKVVEEGSMTRIYKPIVTETACLKCHGNNVSKEIQSEIAARYPKDKAMAFEEGSFRGVIVAKINKH